MLYAPDTLRQMCRCSHHRATHFEGKGACLGMHCDDCHEYRDDTKPVPPPAPSTEPLNEGFADSDDPPSTPATHPGPSWPWAIFP